MLNFSWNMSMGLHWTVLQVNTRENWKSIGDQAIRIIHAIMDQGGLNCDVRCRSFIADSQSYALCMIISDYVKLINMETKAPGGKLKHILMRRVLWGSHFKDTQGGLQRHQSSRFLELEKHQDVEASLLNSDSSKPSGELLQSCSGLITV